MQIVSTIIGKEKETTIRICMLTSGPGLEGLINKLTVLFTHLIKMFNLMETLLEILPFHLP